MAVVSGIPTEHNGTIAFDVALSLEKCVSPYLRCFLNRAFFDERHDGEGPDALPLRFCTLNDELNLQLRGVDAFLNVRTRPRNSPVSIDFKIDTYESGNVAIELISQSTGGKVGYPFKEAQWVVYYFLLTGDVFFLDMSLVTPWVKEQWDLILERKHMREKAAPFRVASTPNQTYETFNLLVPDGQLLRDCPGVYLLRLIDHAPLDLICEPIEAYNEIIKEKNKSRPPDKQQKLLKYVHPDTIPRRIPIGEKKTPAQLATLLTKGNDFLYHSQPSAEEIERLIRWCESYAQVATYKKAQCVKIRKRRKHLSLEEDRLCG